MRSIRALSFGRRLSLLWGALGLLAASGCSDEACIPWQAELGKCLGRKEALEEFQLREACRDSVTSVDSEAVLQDGECCYAVTTKDTCCDDCDELATGHD